METHHQEAGELVRPDDESWIEATDIESVLTRWPERVDLLFDALDLERDGLGGVKPALEAGRRAEACQALIAYYRGPGRCQWILDRLPEPVEQHEERAAEVSDGDVRVANAVGTVPEREHEAWDWNYRGPNRDREYAYELNRHPYFTQLLLGYRASGEEEYAATFDKVVRDWVLHTVCPGDEHQNWWTWRVLETGLRVRHWAPAFHGFADSDAFSPVARLLMLSSLVEHGRYIRRHHWQNHNHALMEHAGLNLLALAFPEFKEAADWHQYVRDEMLSEIEQQVYPDGAHDELSSSYHWCSLSNYEQFAADCRAAGRDVGKDYHHRLERLYDYWVGLVRPTGSLPQNNRSNFMRPARIVQKAATTYQRPDWRYIVTNGREGDPPAGAPSRMAPWAGHLVSRSGWEEDALWSLFDVGPAGHGLVHADALHFSASAYGKDFLVDSGKFWHERGQWLNYALSSRSHNVILPDGCEQKPLPKKTDTPLAEDHWAITDTFDFARGTHSLYKDLDGEAAHTRIVVFLRDLGWVVVDRMRSDRPRELMAMWRFRPEREVELQANGALSTTDTEGANLSITPVGPVQWRAALCRGQEKPHLQGWYSWGNAAWAPNPCAELRGKVGEDTTFAWILLPTPEGDAPVPAGTTLHVENRTASLAFATAGGENIRLQVPLENGHPLVRISDAR